MSAPLLLGLDVGTSAVKAAVIGRDAREVATASAPTPWRAVPTGAELDADALLGAAVRAAAAALADTPDGAVAGIGVAGMAETGVLLDARGRPVVPCIAWHDSRGEDEVRRIADELGADMFAERTGLPLSRLPTLPKYAWMRAHWPDSALGVRWLNVAEWIVRGLGGDEMTEASLASRTGFYDLHAGAQWDAALAWADAPEGLAPPHAPAGTPAGTAEHEGLPRARGAVLAVGGHDHLAAAVGAGAAGADDVLDSCGTAEAWVRASEPLPLDRVRQATDGGITVGWHAVDGRHALLGSVRSGAVLQAVLDLLGVPADARDDLERAALDADPGELALSGFKGEGLVISGIGAGASPAALYRGALEDLGAAGAEIMARMAAVAGPARRLVVTGGWAAGEAARAVKRRHLGPFEHLPEVSTGARGAALAAGRAAAVMEVA